MAWIRRVRTASGATAVQIAESVNGRRRIVRHVGSARDDAELGLLVEAARRLLADDAQHELDLGITPKARKVEMVAAPAGTLFAGASVGPVPPQRSPAHGFSSPAAGCSMTRWPASTPGWVSMRLSATRCSGIW